MVSDRCSAVKGSRRVATWLAPGRHGVESLVGESRLHRVAPQQILEQEPEGIIDQPGDSWDAHSIAESVLGLASADIDRKVASALEAGVLEARQWSDARPVASAVHQKLNAATAVGRSQASGNTVASKFSDGSPSTNPAVHGRHTIPLTQ
jgi:hypothetical protein